MHLQAYGAAGEAVAALNGLADALAEVAGRSEPVLFVYPGHGDGGRWQIATALPREWTG